MLYFSKHEHDRLKKELRKTQKEQKKENTTFEQQIENLRSELNIVTEENVGYRNSIDDLEDQLSTCFKLGEDRKGVYLEEIDKVNEICQKLHEENQHTRDEVNKLLSTQQTQPAIDPDFFSNQEGYNRLIDDLVEFKDSSSERSQEHDQLIEQLKEQIQDLNKTLEDQNSLHQAEVQDMKQNFEKILTQIKEDEEQGKVRDANELGERLLSFITQTKALLPASKEPKIVVSAPVENSSSESCKK